MSKTQSIHEDWEIIKKHSQKLFGPENLQLTSNDVIVLVRVRNSAEYIQPFIQHYLQLGVKHLFFLDNNSTDNTVKLITQFDQVTLFQTQLPYKEYKMAFVHFLLNRFGQHCWSLVVDIDEFFDYPFSNSLPLSALIDYLNSNNYQAVVGQMLDLFPENLMDNQTSLNAPVFPKAHIYYDLSHISKHLHHQAIQLNDWSNYNICIHQGGIRKQWFDLGQTDLTKFPLVRYAPNWTWNSIHRVYPCKVADFSCVLNHYKFRSDFVQFVEAAVKEEQYHQNSRAYKKTWSIIQQKKWPKAISLTTQKNPTPIKLIQEGFLVVSGEYLHFAQSHLKNSVDFQEELLQLAIQEFSQRDQELNQIKQNQHEELHREIRVLKNTQTWKVGTAIVKPLKRIWTLFRPFFKQ